MEKCCGSCKHFGNEDALGLGWCAQNECETTCGSRCKGYENLPKTFTNQNETMETREIKFRGRDIENGHEWCYGSLTTYPNGDKVITYFDSRGFELNCDVDPATVGQYTGLEDRRGREIYEDDILRKANTGMIVRVIYDAPQFCFKLNRNGDRLLDHPEDFEVVGNIHDNPGLLKGDDI